MISYLIYLTLNVQTGTLLQQGSFILLLLLHDSHTATDKKCDCHKKAIMSKHAYLNLRFEINTDVHLGGMYVIFLCLSTTN